VSAVSSNDPLSELIAAAREGAALSSRQQPDPDQFSRVAEFIGTHLEASDDAPLLELASRLRIEDRRALAWYLNILRTLSGTVPAEGTIEHLIFIPVFVTPPLDQSLELGTRHHEIAGALEAALDLGTGSLQLHTSVLPLSTLEAITPCQWHAVATLPRPPWPRGVKPVGTTGVIGGRWSVRVNDKPRLSRKLVHALQRTPALVSWKARTEALLEEVVAGHRVQVFPPMLLQDVFSGIRQFRFAADVEEAARRHAPARQLRWSFDSAAGALKWHLVTDQGDTPVRVSPFPDESVELIENQLERLARRLELKLALNAA